MRRPGPVRCSLWSAAASILLACACSTASYTLGAPTIPSGCGSAALLRSPGVRRMSALRLRGGDDGAEEYSTIFDRIDGVMQATIGRTVWGLLKAVIGWHNKLKRSPSQELAELQQEMDARKLRGNLIDRKFLYFAHKGVMYTLNPLTHISRFLAGTERSVRSAVLFVNAERKSMSVADLRAKLAAPKSKGGMALTNARISEVFYRAALEYTKADMEAPVKELAFADEDDAELEEFKKKALANAAKKGGGGVSEKTLHAAATKKWTGSSGNVVKRLQKELIGIQTTGSFEVELVDDSIFHWWVTIEGAKGSFYEGEKFKLSFKFDAKYPTEPPEVTFVAKVPGCPMPDAPL